MEDAMTDTPHPSDLFADFMDQVRTRGAGAMGATVQGRLQARMLLDVPPGYFLVNAIFLI